MRKFITMVFHAWGALKSSYLLPSHYKGTRSECVFSDNILVLDDAFQYY